MFPYLVHWLLAALTLMVTAHVVPGMEVKSFVAALLASLVIGVVNVLVYPVITLLTLPLTIITFGLFLLIVNGLCLKIAAALTPGFEIVGLLPAVIGSVVLTVLGWLVRFVFYPATST